MPGIFEQLSALTPVTPGMLLEEAFTAKRINAIQDALKYLSDGKHLKLTYEKIPINLTGTTDRPYVLGSTQWGSHPDHKNANGTYGGGAAYSWPSGATARTDTWHRDRRPLDNTDYLTDSVEFILTREFTTLTSSGSNPVIMSFRRKAYFDSRNQLESITAEDSGTIEYLSSGYGTANGGI